ncbi:chorion peroxidase-like [Bradysia coprophila]|uniref:chorion peroxidase-like n=1 Tax=Bradysia coprophila TaxID=38358 RepID=UPI00187DCB14|nr:chorion peroxidase-like [Bradysia coprophila]
MRAVLLLLFAVAFFAIVIQANGDDSCNDFGDFMNIARSKVEGIDNYDSELEVSFTIPDNIFGAFPTYDECSEVNGDIAKLHTYAAQKYTESNQGDIDDFEAEITACDQNEPVDATCRASTPATLPKYRPVDGRGVSPANPEWGASNTPFARAGPAGYQDGIGAIRKAKSGNDLPNVRDIVEKCLTKADRVPVNTNNFVYSIFALMTVLFITHDVHYQTPVQPSDPSLEIQCCAAGNTGLLQANETHSSCFPIEVAPNDPVYGPASIRCINLVRSERSEYTDQTQPGQIMNRATSYLDVSLIYGNQQSELDPIRLYSGGLLRMDSKGVLPVDSTGNYIPSMRRFTMVPMASVWPSLFARNHNTIATRLAELNTCWSDEKLFQEARRINIATFQFNLITSGAVQDSISNIPINENYDPNRNSATSLEFATAYRTPHYYIQPELKLIKDDGTETNYLQSDTIGKMEDILLATDTSFEEAVRGAQSQMINTGVYSDEVINRIGKSGSNGIGWDLISIDLQRARDQGLPGFLQLRRALNLTPVITSFADMYATNFLPVQNIQLLENIYEDAEDIDYYVGCVMETIQLTGNPLVGATSGAVIARQWDNFAGGDPYYYKNPSSPHPFSQEQIWSVGNYTISNLLCANTNMNETAAGWPYAYDPPGKTPPVNPLISCDFFPEMNLAPWEETECVVD